MANVFNRSDPSLDSVPSILGIDQSDLGRISSTWCFAPLRHHYSKSYHPTVFVSFPLQAHTILNTFSLLSCETSLGSMDWAVPLAACKNQNILEQLFLWELNFLCILVRRFTSLSVNTYCGKHFKIKGSPFDFLFDKQSCKQSLDSSGLSSVLLNLSFTAEQKIQQRDNNVTTVNAGIKFHS